MRGEEKKEQVARVEEAKRAFRRIARDAEFANVLRLEIGRSFVLMDLGQILIPGSCD
jgi:hypothetical protein